MKKLFYFLSISLLLASCGSEDLDDDIGNNQSTGDYYPTAINNTWTYGSGSNATTSIFTTTDVFNGKTYYKANTYNGTTTSGNTVISSTWIYKNNGDYILRLGVSGSNPAYTAELSEPVEITILKDYKNVNDTWTQTLNYEYEYTPTSSAYPQIPNITVNATYAYKILNKGLTKTVNGVTFNDVIEVELTYSDLVTNSTTVSTSFYAKDVGIISSLSNGQVTDLTSYQLY